MRFSYSFLAALLAGSFADVYLHSPRGANDRCDEKSNNRDNDKRCWDSENNAAGGYNICDKEMIFYEDTIMRIEWYSQHNCGNGAQVKDDPTNPEAVHCKHLLQLGCDWSFKKFAGGEEATYKLTDGISLGRPGADKYNLFPNNDPNADNSQDTFGDTCTQTKPKASECEGKPTEVEACNGDLRNTRGTFNSDQCKCTARKMQTYCYHEPEAFYSKCEARERNKGLFTATQNPNSNIGARATRQEPNSARYGFECTEERDYWPYWHPSPWIDLAVFVSDTSECGELQSLSFNVQAKSECVDPADPNNKEAWKYNQNIPCTNKGFQWVSVEPYNWDKPACLLAPHQSDNMLARTDVIGDNAGKTQGQRLAYYDWKVAGDLIPKGLTETRCLIRMRYNISTAETPADYDVNDNQRLSQNPVHSFGSGEKTAEVTDSIPIRMAVNTAQYGRVFEDRTWSFIIRKRDTLDPKIRGKTIHNLNVRGKRGNIAQVRNCYEYDFVPLELKADVGDIVYFQWCLSDYNNNGNAGNGNTNSASDRVNVVPIGSFDNNIIQSLNKTNTVFSEEDLKALAWLSQKPEHCYSTEDALGKEKNNANGIKSCHFLNGVRDENGVLTAYFGYMATVVRTGTFHFISSRNNDFTNRSQKGTINVGVSTLSAGAIAGIAVGAVAGVALVAGAIAFVVLKGGMSFSKSRV